MVELPEGLALKQVFLKYKEVDRWGNCTRKALQLPQTHQTRSEACNCPVRPTELQWHLQNVHILDVYIT